MKKEIKVIEGRVGILGKSSRLFVALPEVGRTYVPKELSISEGSILHGTCTVEEKTYTQKLGADGVTLVDRDTPLVRWELIAYTSKSAQLADAVMEGKIKSAATMVYVAKDLMENAELTSA